MRSKRGIKELEKQLRKTPQNLVVRVKLAGAYRELGRVREAVELYRSVAVAYHAQGRLAQATAVCRSVVELEPGQTETLQLLAELEVMQSVEEHATTKVADPRRPLLVRPQTSSSSVHRVVPPPPPGPARALGKRSSEFGQHSGLTPHGDPALAPFDAARPTRPLRSRTSSQPPLHESRQAPRLARAPSLVRETSRGFDAPRVPSLARARRDSAPPQIIPRLPAPLPPVEHAASLPLASEMRRNPAPASEPTIVADDFAEEIGSLESVFDEAPTRLADDDPRPAMSQTAGREQRLPTRSAVASPAGHTAREPFEDSPTNPGRPSTSPQELPSSAASRRGFVRAPQDSGMELERAFAAPFAETVRALAPDGTAVDPPLAAFAAMPVAALEELAQRMRLIRFRAGQRIVCEGDVGEACYVIATGEVSVRKRDPFAGDELIEVARLSDGALFGEFALLADRRRHATVEATCDSDIFEIPRRVLRELAASHAAVGPILESVYRQRLLATLLATASFFAPLAAERRGALLERFVPIRCESGQVIVTEGAPAGGFFLIVLGAVEITKRVAEQRAVLLATLGEGAYFGEMSLLAGGVASATVTVTGPTELAMLPPREFYDVVSRHPVLWDEVRREAHRRRLATSELVTGQTSLV